MKKIITMASAALVLLSLSGVSLAQREGPVQAAPPALKKQTPAAPLAGPPMAPKEPLMTPAEPMATTTAKKSKIKMNKNKKARKEKALKETAPEE